MISPEDRTLIAYRLVDGTYHVSFAVELGVETGVGKARIPPFEETEMDLSYVFGDRD
ncbi:hypothetical protein [Thiocystis violacea]|uniref:hypothetical protein n=1 Tax=Thiocystis violacea TaxID=13725 RepID=UPI001F5B0310